MTATLNPQRLRFQERMVAGGTRVDRDAGLIRDVKIIGTKSANGREYPLDVLRKAASLYEGVAVNINHPTKGNESRSVADRFGTLKNVRVGGDGLYGDLHFIRSHPLAEQVLEMAVRMPTLLGLSHNADGTGRRGASGFIVEAISKVISVDLVCDPATTKSLFESLNVDPRPKEYATKPPQSEIERRNLEGAAQASEVIKKLYARLVAGVVNDLSLSADEKAAAVKELLGDQEYAIDQLMKFGRFYRRLGPLPGDPVTTDANGEEVLAEGSSKPWRKHGGFMEHLRRAEVSSLSATPAKPLTISTPRAYEKGKGFMRHLRGGWAS